MNKLNRFFAGNRATPALLPMVLVSALASQAQAAPIECNSLTNVVYVAGSSAVKPFLAAVAKELANATPSINVVYQGAGSCVGVSLMSSTPAGTITGTASYWDTAGAETTCTITTTETVDMGVSDVYASSCQSTALPTDVKDFFGPIQTMTFVVPAGANGSSQTIISAEAAYLVYGFGNNSEVSPWNDETYIEQRSATSGTQQMLSAFITVPAAKWKGHGNSSGGNLVTSLTASATGGHSEKAIGIVATDVADKNRSTIKILGYQHFGQTCTYWPDSSSTTFDKQNVRDGHYPIWGPLHMLSRTTGGNPLNANAKKIIDYLSGKTVPTSFDLIQVEATGGVVPECAMRVTRSAEAGALASFMPEKSCECKFVKEATGTAPAGCHTCTVGTAATDCPTSAPVCNFGYCEVQ